MNKKLLTLAIGAALVAGPIAAQAEVTVYGHGHLSVDALQADRTVGQEDSSIQVVNNSSRFGIRASEDLGGGLKGEVQYEVLFTNLETTGGTLSTNRDNFIGLAGGFGAIRLGVIDGAVKDAGGVADLFYREQLGESRAIINANATKMDNRVQNGLHYFSPSFGGWVIKAQYGYETENTIGNVGSNEATMMQVGAKGKIGPVALGVGYMQENRPASDTTGLRVGAKVTFGGLDIAALYQTVTDIGGTIGNDQNALGLGAGFKIGKNYIKAQYYVADDLGATASSGATQISVGYDYLFSKTTKVYVTYAQMELDGATVYSIGGNGHGTTAATNVTGGTSSGISVGMIMDF